MAKKKKKKQLSREVYNAEPSMDMDKDKLGDLGEGGNGRDDQNGLAPFDIDPNGDLQLAVHKKTLFKVDSRALSRSSTVFRAMLGGSWAEGKPQDGSEWTVELPEDNPRGLQILLQIIHANFAALPDCPNASTIFHICTVADRYDMIMVLRPWALKWARAAEASGISLEEKVWIAWVLGRKEVFENHAQKLLWTYYPNEYGRLVSSDMDAEARSAPPEPVHDLIVSTGTHAHVLDEREKTLQMFMDTVGKTWQEVSSPGANNRDSNSGSLLLKLHELNIFFTSQGFVMSNKDMSLKQLWDMFEDSRSQCSNFGYVPVQLAMLDIKNTMGPVLTEAQESHFKTRSNLLGTWFRADFWD